MDAANAGTRTTRTGRNEGRTGVFREARWLGWQEIKRSGLSYPVTALAMLLLGWFVATSVDGMLTIEGFGEGGKTFAESFDVFFTDFIFLNFGALLAVNWTSREYFRVFSEDAFSERLTFVRGLPISAATLVLGRLISMCFALLLNVPALFLPVYLVSNLNGLGWDFLWFVLTWTAYSFIGAGLWLMAELTIRGRNYVRLSFAWTLLQIPVVILLEWALNLEAVARTAGLAEAHGPLPALVSLFIGTVVLAVLTRATVSRVERRDLYA